jgi:CRP-like cAMP-binding protein
LDGILSDITTLVLKRIPLFSDLDEIELVQVMACFSMRSVAAGEVLYAEGSSATSACFVISGKLEALTALPGGGEARVGLINPGDMIGEMALVAGSSRTATVRALADVSVVTVSFAFFQAALNQMSVPAFKILRRIMHSLSDRLEVLHKSIFTAWDCDGFNPVESGVGNHATDFDNGLKPSFDYRPFLAVTSFFEAFEETEIDCIVESASVLEMPRNEYLWREGDAAGCSFVVVRGAVDNTIMRDRRYQLSVLGPGRLCGSNSMIKDIAHCCDMRTRSDSLVLRFDRKNFTRLFNGSDIPALKFQARVSHNQLLELKSADNLLTTLVSQAHVCDAN